VVAGLLISDASSKRLVDYVSGVVVVESATNRSAPFRPRMKLETDTIYPDSGAGDGTNL
jgi:hypothetical protein